MPEMAIRQNNHNIATQLAKVAKIHNLNVRNWTFPTGKRSFVITVFRMKYLYVRIQKKILTRRYEQKIYTRRSSSSGRDMKKFVHNKNVAV